MYLGGVLLGNVVAFCRVGIQVIEHRAVFEVPLA